MVNESTVYRPDTEHTKSMDVTLERFFPSNGTTFTKTSASFIEIPITVRKNGFLVPQPIQPLPKTKCKETIA